MGAIAGAVAGPLIGGLLGGGGSSGASGQAMQAADPFAAYRSQFGQQTVDQMPNVQGAMNTANTTATQNAATQQGLASTYATQMAGLSAPSQAISNQMTQLATDPSSLFQSQAGQAYMQQAQEAQQRTGASQGMTSSGNEQLALQNAMMANSQGYAQNQMGMYGSALSGATNTANLTGSNLTSGMNAQVAGLGVSTNAAQQGLSNQGNYLSQLMQLSGASQTPSAGYSAAVGGTSAGLNNMQNMSSIGGQLGTQFGNSSVGQSLGNWASGLFGGGSPTVVGGPGSMNGSGSVQGNPNFVSDL